eukprot:gene3770-4694_t
MSVYQKTVSHAPATLDKALTGESDDWDTDPDYVNDVSEMEQRRGSRLIVPPPSGTTTMDELRQKVADQDSKLLKEEYAQKKTLYGEKADR